MAIGNNNTTNRPVHKHPPRKKIHHFFASLCVYFSLKIKKFSLFFAILALFFIIIIYSLPCALLPAHWPLAGGALVAAVHLAVAAEAHRLRTVIRTCQLT